MHTDSFNRTVLSSKKRWPVTGACNTFYDRNDLKVFTSHKGSKDGNEKPLPNDGN